MENPVVVFFDKSRRPETAALTLAFPIGWNEQGERFDGKDAIKGQVCCLILLDDADERIPACEHKNKTQDKPLLIVVHENSTFYQNPESNEAIGGWGKCTKCEKFSHVHGDKTFLEILGLLANSKEAIGFAQKRRGLMFFELLDHLATICQIGIIAPDRELAQIENDFRQRIELIDPEFAREYRLGLDWPSKLAAVRGKAALLYE